MVTALVLLSTVFILSVILGIYYISILSKKLGRMEYIVRKKDQRKVTESMILRYNNKAESESFNGSSINLSELRVSYNESVKSLQEIKETIFNIISKKNVNKKYMIESLLGIRDKISIIYTSNMNYIGRVDEETKISFHSLKNSIIILINGFIDNIEDEISDEISSDIVTGLSQIRNDLSRIQEKLQKDVSKIESVDTIENIRMMSKIKNDEQDMKLNYINILWVDDNFSLVSRTIKNIKRNFYCNITYVANWNRGREEFIKHEYDLVVLDNYLKEERGSNIAKQIRDGVSKSNTSRYVPILVCSGENASEEYQELNDVWHIDRMEDERIFNIVEVILDIAVRKPLLVNIEDIDLSND